MENKIQELQAEAIEAATQHIREQRKANENMRIKVYCLTVLMIVSIVCATVIACFSIYSQQQTIIEQQYALNMQYAGLLDYVSGAEVTTTTEANSGDNGNAIIGDGNMIAGGDVNGDS